MALLTRYDYRRVTGDMTSLDVDVDGALATALQTLEESLGRSLEAISRTETVRIHSDGRAYVRCTPLISVSIPTNAVIRDNAILGLIPQLNPQYDVLYEPLRQYGEGPGWVDNTFPVASVTYVGGFTADTLPRKLRQAICDLARVELTVFDPTAAGVTRASVGDTSVTYAESPDRAGTVQAILFEVRGYRRRELGW